MSAGRGFVHQGAHLRRVLVGAEDVFQQPGYADAIASAVPGAELRPIEEAGHLSNLDQPELFTDYVVQFLSTAG